MRNIDSLNYVLPSSEGLRLLPLKHPSQREGGPFIELDFENFTKMAAALDERLRDADLGRAGHILRTAGMATSPLLYKTTQETLNVIKEKYPAIFDAGSVDFIGRNFAYAATVDGFPVRLSEAFDRNIAMCTEITALSQLLLKHRGMESDLVCAAVGHSAEGNNVEEYRHFFLVVRGQGDHPVIFDPSMSMTLTYTKMLPFLSTVTEDDLKRMDNFESIGVLPDTTRAACRNMPPERYYGFAIRSMGDDMMGPRIAVMNPAHIEPLGAEFVPGALIPNPHS